MVDQMKNSIRQKNHTATQSSFASPCGQLSGGFDTGLYVVIFKRSTPDADIRPISEPVAADATSFPTVMYTVKDTKATWFFCAQGGGAHCAAGMVFAINCGADGAANSFANFKAAAMATKPGSNPYTPNPSGGSSSLPGTDPSDYQPTVVTQSVMISFMSSRETS